MSLHERLAEAARTPVLLIASDYDGTLAPIVASPEDARPQREAIVALRNLAQLPRTYAAVISGRALDELSRLSGLPEEVHLVGSHGSEFDHDFARSLAPELVALRETLERELGAIAADTAGAAVETKPASVALHYRNAEPEAGAAAVERALAGPARRPGVHVKRGKKVLELAVVATEKGGALERLRGQLGVTATVFLGDDVTDEDAFATLHGPDVAIKVGPGETRAPHRVGDTGEVARVLAELCEERAAWLSGGAAVPISDHALLSDNRTVALVTPDARVTWACLPRADSPSMFAELLGGPPAGYFAVRPDGDDVPAPRQAYVGDSLLLETVWPSLTVTDLLDCGDGRALRRSGRVDLVRVLRGSGRVRIELAPRPDFARIAAAIREEPGGLRIFDGPDPFVLRAPEVAWTLRDEGGSVTAIGELDLDRAGGEVALELRYGTANLDASRRPVDERVEATRRYWSSWAETLRVPDVAPELVRRSALAIKGLCHGPTGAILAAGTTSLPESLGGVRNWDYRFCWPRDAALAASALVRLGSTSEAMALCDWLLAVCQGLVSPAQLRPLYAVDRGMVSAEAEIGELSGYRGSRPVRIGNSAVHQVQLDVFGPIVDLVHDLLLAGAPLSTEHWRLVEGMAEAVVERWREPDHGIWEERLHPRHHVHSKTMCWLTLDRAVELARELRGNARSDWERERDAIRADVLTHAFDARRGAFTGAYGSHDLDAAALQVGLSGLVPPQDARFVATVEAVERELRRGPTVLRYDKDDGLPGREGGFHLCAAWLVEALLAVGRPGDARALFEAWTAHVGITGLLSEQLDGDAGLALGNHPQAYSHTALIRNACSLAEAAAQ